VVEKIKPVPIDVIELFKGHRFEGIIGNLELDEIADIIRHTVIINKDKLGWEMVDEIGYAIKDYTPRWELPALHFDKGLREVFITRVNWDPSNLIRQLLHEFFEDYSKIMGAEVFQDRSVLPFEQKIWSFRELYILLNEISFLISNYTLELNSEGYGKLVNAIFQQFEENYRNKIYEEEQRIGLIFLVVKATLSSGMIDVDRLQILLDNSMNLIKQLDQETQQSYRLLYGYIYAIFWYNLFTSTSDLIMQRDLVAEIIDDIYKPEKMELKDWGKYIISSKPHPLVLSLLLSGYMRLDEMIFTYAESLPDSNQRNNLINIRSDLIDFMDEVKDSFLEKYYNVKHGPWDFEEQFSSIESKIKYVNIQRLLKRIILQVSKEKLIANKEALTDPNILTRYETVLKESMVEGLAELEFAELCIMTEHYPYDLYFDSIVLEYESGDSIILSSTFEEEIIRKIGNIFAAIQEKNKRNDRIDIRDYEVMVLYTLNWMTKLYNNYGIRYEAIMILSPLISIAYIQIAKGYLDKNNLEGAFLSYFNSYYLMEMVNQDLKGYSVSGSGDSKSLKEKFESLLGEWGIEDLSDEESIKRLFNSIEHSIKDRTMKREDKSFSMGGMLEDDIVIGYLDIITQLETFNQLAEISSGIREAIASSEIFTPPPEIKLFRSDHYGSTLDPLLQQQFPFPIIRNIAAASVGIKLYPIELKMPEQSLSFDKTVPDVRGNDDNN
ncbi:MAG: hypothetical protein ACXAE3_07405, partial [Candidatus Kariarchaeaceae archaeon]|jgi:hypothetical protein